MYILAGWAFVAFLYFKITFDAVFYQDLSVLASLLMGGILGVFIYFIDYRPSFLRNIYGFSSGTRNRFLVLRRK